MPYRKAWHYVSALLVLTFVAFWPTYLSRLGGALWAHHAHAASAVLWTVLVALQAWSIHNGQRKLHRTAGLAVFALFPFFMVAGMWVIHVEATTLLHGLDDPASVEIAQFGFFDPLANAGYAAMFWGGLAYRREPQRHARYISATVLFVVAPVIWRLLRGYVAGVADLPFDYPFAAGNLGALVIALVLYRQNPQYGRPFLVTAAIIAAQAILFLTAGKLPGWAPIFASVANADLFVLLAVTGIVSIGIAWHGWMTGSRRRAIPDKRVISSPAV